MKMIHTKYLVIILLAIFVSSCEKGIDTVETGNNVYIPQSGLSVQTALLGSSVYNLGVYYAGLNQSVGSVNVTLGVDEAAAAIFIAQNAGYEILPASYYSLPQSSVTVSTGNERAMFPIQLKNIDDKFTEKKYILPISIKSVDKDVTVVEAEKTAILQFKRFRNVYEAKYKSYGKTVLAGTADSEKAAVDEIVTASSVDASTISVKGAAAGLTLLLKVQGGQVQVSGATGSEAFNVTNTAGKTSTYEGTFNEKYQCNTGTFKLFYTYTAGGKQMDASVELSFWF